MRVIAERTIVAYPLLIRWMQVNYYGDLGMLHLTLLLCSIFYDLWQL